MEIIDAHCHIFPEKIAKKAVKTIGEFYDLKMDFDGTSNGLNNILEENNIAGAVVHATATKPDQVPSINKYIVEQVKKYPKFIGFGTMHPDYDKTYEEYVKMKENGLMGVKLHPDFQFINIDDPKMDIIYEIIGDELPVLFHVGDPVRDYSNPKRLAKVMKRFPKLKVIAAHMGGYQKWDESIDILERGRIWVDTCSSFPFLSNDKIKKLINLYGVDKVMFGTDYPMWDLKNELKRIETLNLKESELEKIMSKNIKTLLNI